MRRCPRLATVASALLLGLAVAGCGPSPEPQAPRLEITRQRWNVDDKAGLVRVVGEVLNRGAKAVPEVEVRAILMGASGEPRGENTSPILRDLAPGERRQFALNVRSHGGVARVELVPQLPKK